ncbi:MULTISPECIES: ATP-binding protein [unclassified Luteibacter]|uniref:ATP-binding protein n=1 Tax=Luteibacter sp. PvP019 TaxID=3156436 RepID=UPI0033983C58
MPYHLKIGRGLILWACALVAAAVVLDFASSYALYALLPDPTAICENDSWIPTRPELLWLVLTATLAIAFAGPAALRLSRRFVQPIDSLAAAIRCAAQGDLSARAIKKGRPFGEIASLLDDYNALAERWQQADKDMTVWNAVIAHELRTPVTILRGRLQGLADGVFEPTSDMLRNLVRHVEALSRLVEDLRVVSLAEGGHLRLDPADVDLRQALLDVVAFVAPTMPDHILSVDADETPVIVRCDAMRVRQALIALIDNARRHSNPGKITLSLTLRATSVDIGVHDAGPGVPPELLTRMFQTFSRGETSHPGRSGGSGLGLAVVRSIAIAHHGSVTYHGGDGAAATFTLTLPTGTTATSTLPPSTLHGPSMP